MGRSISIPFYMAIFIYLVNKANFMYVYNFSKVTFAKI